MARRTLLSTIFVGLLAAGWGLVNMPTASAEKCPPEASSDPANCGHCDGEWVGGCNGYCQNCSSSECASN